MKKSVRAIVTVMLTLALVYAIVANVNNGSIKLSAENIVTIIVLVYTFYFVGKKRRDDENKQE